VKIFAVVADTGRPSPGGPINLLNAGWTATVALPVDEGGYTLPGQALAVFLEAPWDQLNRPHRVTIELLDDEGQLAELSTPTADGFQPARIEQEITIPPVAGAPNGIPGLASLLLDLPLGTLRIRSPRRRYTWRVTLGGDVGETGFWVQALPTGPTVGGRPNG